MARMPSIDVEINVTERAAKRAPSALRAVGSAIAFVGALLISAGLVTGVLFVVMLAVEIAARLVAAVLP